MSDVKYAPAWYPPAFPERGRLPHLPEQVWANQHRRSDQERAYHNALCVAAGRRVMPPCCKTLYVSLCFDGTGNNLNHDLYVAKPPHPTNIARMFRASIGAGHAGGTGHLGSTAGLTDEAGVGNGEYFKYYIPGVGTPFAEIGELDYNYLGLGGGRYGEARINWAFLMLVDALRRALGQPRLDDAAVAASVKAMSASLTMKGPGNVSWVNSRARRAEELRRQLGAIHRPLKIALEQPHPGHPMLMGIKLYVYGFSRGAAAARAFVSWLNEMLVPDCTAPALAVLDIQLPISVEYLGLLDTVASVGLADLLPAAEGHMAWADGNQEIPEGPLVKRCLHMVAAHEQRLCFPLESIRRAKGEYPTNSVEVVYPGVHSDVGGGYTPGDQGKAIGRDDYLLLSQIALNDLYADAFAQGAPLKAPTLSLPEYLRGQSWRVMGASLALEFFTAPVLVQRFNAWCKLTCNEVVPDFTTIESHGSYQLHSSIESLESLLCDQMGWLTGWRIDRYAFASYKQAPFYLQATDNHADPDIRALAQKEHQSEQFRIKLGRLNQAAKERSNRATKVSAAPSLPGFDADLARTQLREAAAEFAEEYRERGLLDRVAIQVSRIAIIPALLLYQYTQDARAERLAMKAAGMAKVSLLFPPPVGYFDNHVDENTRVLVDEARNAKQPEGLLRALFDDQIHDSRAWFLYAMGREPGGSYFSERMVFFGNSNRRDLAVYSLEESQALEIPKPAYAIDASPALAPTEEEKLAAFHQSVNAHWDAAFPKVRGSTNENV